ncbi:MAG: hypothetical protein JNL11_04345 [Bdellovibrionaceae bacterium]|nr:hypothetical protein [Pseudobdellovibrionaceae bacterium]
MQQHDLEKRKYEDMSSLPIKSVFVAAHATKLSLVEIILGSVVHGLNIPFGGNLLSLNQGAFLCRATQKFAHDRREGAYVSLQVSTVSSILKSLSPAGQKLGPMIAIGMQGVLYSTCVLILGTSRVSQSVGMMFLSLWSFVQPIFMLWLFYGESLSEAAVFFYEKLRQTIPSLANIFVLIFIILIGIKVIVAVAIPWVLSYFGEQRFDSITDLASDKAAAYMNTQLRGPARNHWDAIRYTFRDLTRPAFLIPCLLVTFFLVFSETKNAQWIWKMLRPLAVATIFFYITNTPWMHRLFNWMKAQGYFPHFLQVLEQTKNNLAQKRSAASDVQAKDLIPDADNSTDGTKTGNDTGKGVERKT